MPPTGGTATYGSVVLPALTQVEAFGTSCAFATPFTDTVLTAYFIDQGSFVVALPDYATGEDYSGIFLYFPGSAQVTVGLPPADAVIATERAVVDPLLETEVYPAGLRARFQPALAGLIFTHTAIPWLRVPRVSFEAPAGVSEPEFARGPAVQFWFQGYSVRSQALLALGGLEGVDFRAYCPAYGLDMTTGDVLEWAGQRFEITNSRDLGGIGQLVELVLRSVPIERRL